MRLLGGGGAFSPGSLLEAVIFFALWGLVAFGVVSTVLASASFLGSFGSLGCAFVRAVFAPRLGGAIELVALPTDLSSEPAEFLIEESGFHCIICLCLHLLLTMLPTSPPPQFYPP